MNYRKITAHITALAMCTALLATFTLPETTVVKGKDIVPSGTLTDRDYTEFQIYRMPKEQGEASLTQTGLDSAELLCRDTDTVEFSGRKYFNRSNPAYMYGDITAEYDLDFRDFNPETDDVHMYIEGKLAGTNTELIIVEAWGSWRPDPGQFLATVTIDGTEYDLYRNHYYQNTPGLVNVPGNEHDQYWCVRSENKLTESGKISGSVCVSDYLREFAEYFDSYPLNYIGVSVNSYQTDFTGSINSFKVKTEVPEAAVTENNADNYFNGLKDGWTDYFTMGAAVDGYRDYSTYKSEFMCRNYGILTPANDPDPEVISSKSVYGEPYDELSSILDFCAKNDVPFHGRGIITSTGAGTGFFRDKKGEYVTPEVMDERLENYIKSLFGPENNGVNIESYEVCRDVLYLIDGVPPYGGESEWMKVYGDDSFIEKAFIYARKYAPEGCKLYLSDDNNYNAEDTDRICEIASGLKEKGLLDGITMCSSMYEQLPDMADYESALKKYTDSGLEIIISDLQSVSQDSSRNAQVYSDLFRLYSKYSKNINSIIMKNAYDEDSYSGSGMFYPSLRRSKSYYSVMGYAAELAREKNPDILSQNMGDADGNGVVNSADLIAMVKVMVGAADLTPEIKRSCDFNHDGYLTVLDVINLKKLVLK